MPLYAFLRRGFRAVVLCFISLRKRWEASSTGKPERGEHDSDLVKKMFGGC